MKVYKCIVSGDELFTDTYKYEITDGVLRIVAKHVTRSGDKIDDRAFGGNPSAEDGAEEAADDPNSISGINLVLDFRLHPAPVFNTKKEYGLYFKGYLKKVSAKLALKADFDEAAFQARAKVAFGKLSTLFKEAEYFLGESENEEGIMVPCIWEDVDGEQVPVMYFFYDGLVAEKC